MDVFDTYYYDQDHLGNIRQVTDKSGKAVQTTDYYPFGMQLCDGTTSNFDQNHKYNGKEFDKLHGLNTYDYGARQYNPVTARWDRMDPLCEKYYSVSPYAYCMNNPVIYTDPDGRDGKVTGTGTENDPYVITAIYIYKKDELGQDQIDGLNNAISEYNSSGVSKITDSDGKKCYVKYNLSAEESDDPEMARSKTCFEGTDGNPRYYGNIVGTQTDSGEEYGSANNTRIDFNVSNIESCVADGMSSKEINRSVAIHEIAHNLGAEHTDGTKTMSSIGTNIHNSDFGHSYTYFTYPSTSKGNTQKIMSRRDTTRKAGEGRLWTQIK